MLNEMKSRPAGNIKEIAYKDRSEFLRGFSVIIRKNIVAILMKRQCS